MKTLNYILALAAVCVSFMAANLWAIPAGFNVQGRLTDANEVKGDGSLYFKANLINV